MFIFDDALVHDAHASMVKEDEGQEVGADVNVRWDG